MSFESLIEPLMAKLRLMVGRCVISASRYKNGELLADIELVDKRIEIDDKEKIVSLRRRPSHKAEDAPVAVVRVHPFKSLIALVICVKGRIFPVHIQQIPHIGLQMLAVVETQRFITNHRSKGLVW